MQPVAWCVNEYSAVGTTKLTHRTHSEHKTAVLIGVKVEANRPLVYLYYLDASQNTVIHNRMGMMGVFYIAHICVLRAFNCLYGAMVYIYGYLLLELNLGGIALLRCVDANPVCLRAE